MRSPQIVCWLAAVVVLIPGQVVSQEVFRPLRTDNPPVIDGVLDDPVWANAPSLTGFKTWRPDYEVDMAGETVVKAAYDGENLYFAFRCYDSEPDQIKTSVTNRDNIVNDDWVAVNLDSFNDQQAMYVMYVNPAGIQGDTRYAGGHEDRDFDMVWYSSGQIDEEGYTVEIRLPLESIRFADTDPTYMGVIFERSIVRSREAGTYPPLDPALGESWLTQTMPMEFSNFDNQTLLELLPAVTYAYSQAQSGGEMVTTQDDPEVSLTAKYGLTSELVLDGTYNPDFSQVEADAGQVDVNLRHDLFYPEKRPFFLEGRAHFGLGGTQSSALDPLSSIVHTRRIVDPIVGTRVTGKLGENDIIAAIYAVDELPGTSASDDTEYAHIPIVRYKRKLDQDAYVGGIYTARGVGSHLNVVGGADGLLRLTESSTIGYHGLLSHTREDETTPGAGGHAIGVAYARATRDISYGFAVKDVSEDFQTETGYLTRTGVSLLSGHVHPRFYPGTRFLQRVDFRLATDQTRDRIYDMWETSNSFGVYFYLLNRMTFSVRGVYSTEVFLGERFNTGSYGVATSARISNRLSASVQYRRSKSIFYGGSPYQGNSNLVTANLNLQPTDNLRVEGSFVYFDFHGDSEASNDYDYPILRGKLTYQVSRYLFFRGIVEYNDYRDELLTDLLASFTYIPGTVLHVGYGTLYDKTRWETDRYVASDRFVQTQRQLFVKGSYLWRM